MVGSVAYRGDAGAAATPGSPALADATATQTHEHTHTSSVGEHDPQQDQHPSVRPGLVTGALGRQQSWKLDDKKRAVMERILSSEKVQSGGGYTTSQVGV